MAGIAAVTLLPGDAGLRAGQCDTGMPTHLFTSESSLLNIALFAPGALLAVLLFRRPVTAAAGFGCLSGTIEVVQSFTDLGRSCSVTDLVANVTGAALGSLAGALWLYRQRQPLRRPMRDVVWGVSVAAVSAVAVAAVFHYRIDSVDVVAMDDQKRDIVNTAEQADEWITEAAKGIYGSDTQVSGTAVETVDGRVMITAETSRGSISGLWPEKDLVKAWSSNTRGDEGSFGEEQVADAADTFARKWFPDNVAESKQQIRSIGDGATRAYIVNYRRYADDVMMPMRLDITITTTGRVIGFTARSIDDPNLPPVVVSEGEARKLAEKQTGLSSDSTLLLAQLVEGRWRPVWLVGSGDEDVVIDAATGEVVADAGHSPPPAG